MSPFQDNDTELVLAIARGDRAAFKTLYDRYQEEMYRLAVRKLHDRDIAEEVVQDIFVGLWENRGRLAIGQVRNYLLRSVRNHVLDHIRAQVVRQNYARQFAGSGEAYGNVTEEWMALHELNEAIQAGIAEMPDKTKEIFRLNRVDFLSADEISGILQLPKRTVEYHITVALRTMRKCLKDFLPLWLLFHSF